MLRNLNSVMGAAVVAIDGDVGHVKDLYFDDQSWVLRYLVVETGSWLSSRRVLISPVSISGSGELDHVISVSITRDQVKSSPDIDSEKPVSRQHEVILLDYYKYPIYWGSAGLWGAMDQPNLVMPDFVSTPSVIAPQADHLHIDPVVAPHHGSDPHLRSVEALESYAVQASDGETGHIRGLLLDEKTWAIRYLVVSTSKWWLGHDVLIAPQWIKEISWSEREVTLRVDRHALQECVAYDPGSLPDRNTEIRMHDHYGYTGYWLNEQRLSNVSPVPIAKSAGVAEHSAPKT